MNAEEKVRIRRIKHQEEEVHKGSGAVIQFISKNMGFLLIL